MQILLDTDIDTDCDDAGALAVLHALRNRGEATIVGVICNVPLAPCALCVHAINATYGCDDIPVGLIRLPDWDTNPRHAAYRQHREKCTGKGAKPLYNEIVSNVDANHPPDPACPDAVPLYRALLSRAPDKSITICAIGTLTALAALLESPPDAISPLSGPELVAAKVRTLVSMAKADAPTGRDEFNWAMDLPAAARVASQWPTDLLVSTGGQDVLTGARFMASSPPDHPVHRAYRTFLGSESANRPSWDQLAVMYAVLGASPLFREEWHKGLTIDSETGIHEWKDANCAGRRGRIYPALDPETLAERVEDLMVESLQ